jgi:CRISPR-associated protein Cmr5
MKANSLDQDIPKAIDALKKYKVVEGGAYPKQFNGYISAFGASVMQAGLLPTVVFYSSDSRAEENRSQLLCVLREMLAPAPNGDGWRAADLYAIVAASSGQDRRRLEDRILGKAIAVKLALRLFEKKTAVIS